jgi:hypothetical protein
MSAPSEDQILEKAKELCRCEGTGRPASGRPFCWNNGTFGAAWAFP